MVKNTENTSKIEKINWNQNFKGLNAVAAEKSIKRRGQEFERVYMRN